MSRRKKNRGNAVRDELGVYGYGAPNMWQSAVMNNATYNDYFFRLRSIAMNRFEWVGLPDTVDERFLERGLFDKGRMLFFYDGPELGYLTLYFTPNSPINHYDVPLRRDVYTSNSEFTFTGNEENSVIIYNNYSHLPDLSTTSLFAARIADIQRSIDVNIMGQKTPKIVLGPKEKKLEMKNLWMNYTGNEPVFFGDDNFRNDFTMTVLDTTAPYVADVLEIQKHQMMNEYLSYLGIENNNASDKKERLVADEVTSNYGLVENSRNVALNSRLQACEQINKMFGLNVSVKFKSEVQTTVNEPNLGGAEDGEADD